MTYAQAIAQARVLIGRIDDPMPQADRMEVLARASLALAIAHLMLDLHLRAIPDDQDPPL